MNRAMELKLRELEILYSLLSFEHYPIKKMDELWKKVLLNQFHDIITGSSITPFYEQCREDYESLTIQIKELEQKAGSLLLKKDENSLCLFNTLSFTYKRPIELPQSWKEYSIFDEDRNEVLVQEDYNCAVIFVEIPPLSTIHLKRSNKKKKNFVSQKSTEMILENDLIRYEQQTPGF